VIENLFEEVRLTRDPQPARSSEYEEAAAEMEALLLELPGLIAIYRTGSVSVPGISDLDLVCVIEEPNAPLPSFWQRLAPRTRELAMHTPFVVDIGTFRKHRSFAYLEPLSLTKGTAVDLEEPRDVDACETLIGVEGLLFSLLRLSKQARAGCVKVRPTLCELHSLRHDLRLLRLGRDRAPSAWGLADGIASLRSGWFDEPERERIHRLRRLLRDAVGAISEALWGLDHDLGDLDDVERLTLGGAWANVTIVAEDHSSLDLRSRPAIRAGRYLFGGRIAELAWRLARHELTVPRPAVRLLAQTDQRNAGFLRDRQALVQRYRRLMSEMGGTYSAIGAATALCP
jgi:hypothetical protein